MDKSEKEFRSYAEFWPYYLSQHSHRRTKIIHLVGLVLALLSAVAIGLGRSWVWSPIVLVLGYGPAWLAHFFIEGNKPATFGHPWWSLISDFRMAYRMLQRKL